MGGSRAIKTRTARLCFPRLASSSNGLHGQTDGRTEGLTTMHTPHLITYRPHCGWMVVCGREEGGNAPLSLPSPALPQSEAGFIHSRLLKTSVGKERWAGKRGEGDENSTRYGPAFFAWIKGIPGILHLMAKPLCF